MRILMLSDVYFPRVNGVSSSIRWFALELTRRGHEVVVVAPEYGTPVREDTFEILRFPARTLFFDPEDRLLTRGALRDAERALAQQHWDVIHVHTPFQAHRLGVRLARRLGTPIVESYHTYFEQYVGHYLPYAPASWLRAAARTLSRRICAAVDHLVVPTREMARVLDGYGIRAPRTILPTGIDLAEFASGDGAAFRRAHGIGPDRPVAVTVSRLAREKNISLLLDAIAHVRASVPDVLLLVAGEGPDDKRLRAHVRSTGLDAHVRFFGYLDRRKELLDFYRAGDVFAFASPTETQGLVLIEALALGVPVVSTAVMGTATVLEGARGACIAPENAEGFARVLSRVLLDAEMRCTLAQAAPGDAVRWSTVAIMDGAVDMYQSLVRSRVRELAATGA